MGARSISFLYTAESSQGGVCSRQDSMVLAKTGYVEDLPQRTRWGRSILRIETMDSAMKLSGSLAWSFGIPLIVICCCRKVRTLIGVYFWSGLLERACEIHSITLSYVGHNSIWRWASIVFSSIFCDLNPWFAQELWHEYDYFWSSFVKFPFRPNVDVFVSALEQHILIQQQRVPSVLYY